MIIIDGRQTEMKLNSFANLEEVLVRAMQDPCLENRIVTDVKVNEENFSEIYPHQAEDIDCHGIETVEIISMNIDDMVINILDELNKVVRLMNSGACQVAALFRQADDAEALELFQDLLDVTRNFLSMVGLLRSEYTIPESEKFAENVEVISNLFGEMTEVLEHEDWVLLADLLGYEYIPATMEWLQILSDMTAKIKSSMGK